VRLRGRPPSQAGNSSALLDSGLHRPHLYLQPSLSASPPPPPDDSRHPICDLRNSFNCSVDSEGGGCETAGSQEDCLLSSACTTRKPTPLCHKTRRAPTNKTGKRKPLICLPLPPDGPDPSGPQFHQSIWRPSNPLLLLPLRPLSPSPLLRNTTTDAAARPRASQALSTSRALRAPNHCRASPAPR
jgi:hypothetical protein